MTWTEFVTELRKPKYRKGYAVSDEGKDGIFHGPISKMHVTRKSAAITVAHCTRNMHGRSEITAERNCISGFSYDGVAPPQLDPTGSITYYVYMIGSITIYPKNHPKILEYTACAAQAA